MGLIGTPKSFASLSSGLLARKGQARPAMRSQGFAGFSGLQGALDDLGWNDMGTPEPQPAAEPVAQVISPPPAGLPPVLRERAQLREEIEDTSEPAVTAEPVAPPPARPAATVVTLPVAAAPETTRIALPAGARTTKAAFTLRLDPDRHLRLRLAGAVAGRSGQQLVTEALDQWLERQDTIEELARRVPAQGERAGGR